MVKTIIFDWGGVLIENPAPAMLSYFADSLGVRKEKLHSVGRNLEQKFIKFQKGMASEETIWEKICFKLSIQNPGAPSLWGEAFRGVYKPREEMFSLAHALKERGYKTGVLSNAEIPAMEYFYEQRYDMFDVAVFSCAVGMLKPERRIYEIALEQLETQPNDAVFIDDRKNFIEGAKDVGINTILFTSPGQVKEKLADFSVKIR